MKLICKIFCVAIFSLGFTCHSANNEVQSADNNLRPNVAAPVSQAGDQTLIQTITNKKYGMSLLFYKKSEQKFPYLLNVKLRLDKTGKTVDLYTRVLDKEAVSDDAVNFWSPDEEFMVLHGQRLAVIASSKVLKYLSKSTNGKSKSLENVTAQDVIEILTDKKNPRFRLSFKRWQDSASFIFSVNKSDFTNPSKNTAELAEFRYDFVKKDLYRKIDPNDPQSRSKFMGMIGKNKKGFILGGAMKDDPVN